MPFKSSNRPVNDDKKAQRLLTRPFKLNHNLIDDSFWVVSFYYLLATLFLANIKLPKIIANRKYCKQKYT